MRSMIRLRLGLHQADVNRIGTKLDTIRFTSDSDPLHFSTKVCVYTERVDNFVRARSMLSCEKRLFSLFISQSSKTFESNFLCPVTMQSDPNVSSIPSLFFKAILH